MPSHRKIVRRTMGKEARIMSRSALFDIDAGSLTHQVLVKPSVFAGALSGASNVFNEADTEMVVSPNAIIKYINIRFETGLRDVSPAAPGFIEYAIVILDQAGATYVIPAGLTANFGTKTVGDLCRNLYRGNCIWNGSFPVSRELPRVIDMSIRIPDKFCKCKNGQEIVIVIGHHGLNVADTTTEARTYFSTQFKAYI